MTSIPDFASSPFVRAYASADLTQLKKERKKKGFAFITLHKGRASTYGFFVHEEAATPANSKVAKEIFRARRDWLAEEDEDERGQVSLQIKNCGIEGAYVLAAAHSLGLVFEEFTFCTCCSPQDAILFFKKAG